LRDAGGLQGGDVVRAQEASCMGSNRTYVSAQRRPLVGRAAPAPHALLLALAVGARARIGAR
jgi:hypothetical protein